MIRSDKEWVAETARLIEKSSMARDVLARLIVGLDRHFDGSLDDQDRSRTLLELQEKLDDPAALREMLTERRVRWGRYRAQEKAIIALTKRLKGALAAIKRHSCKCRDMWPGTQYPGTTQFQCRQCGRVVYVSTDADGNFVERDTL